MFPKGRGSGLPELEFSECLLRLLRVSGSSISRDEVQELTFLNSIALCFVFKIWILYCFWLVCLSICYACLSFQKSNFYPLHQFIPWHLLCLPSYKLHIFKFCILLCVCAWTHVPGMCVCGDKRFFLFTMWVPEKKLRSSELIADTFALWVIWCPPFFIYLFIRSISQTVCQSVCCGGGIWMWRSKENCGSQFFLLPLGSRDQAQVCQT